MAGASFSFVWHGTAIQRQVVDLNAQALEKVRAESEGYAKSVVHVLTGRLQRETYATLTTAPGPRWTMAIGSTAPYALFEELGTRFRPGHPQLRLALNWAAERVLHALAAARDRTRSLS